MYRYTRLVLISIGLFISFGVNPLPAGLITFNVDLSGVDEFYGNTLRVFGTLTVDPTQPITYAGISSALNFQRNSEPAIRLPSIPYISGPVSDNLAWLLFDDMLFINRTGTDGAGIQWVEFGSSSRWAFTLVSGPNPHWIEFTSQFLFDEVFLAGSGPTGGTFLLGTIVPEISSILMLSLIGTLIPLLRWRRC